MEQGDEPEAHAAETTEPGESPLLVENALATNGINLNGINLNGINLNALQMSALNDDARAAIEDPGASGDLARHALRYIVSCALTDEDSFAFSWTDAGGAVHQESYLGLLGLAAGWSSGPISTKDAEWVSACLISRVNRYGVSVLISSRGKHNELKHVDDVEVETFTHREGAFWGNLFSATPEAYSCHDAGTVTFARQHQRACAAGHLDEQGQVVPCGIVQILGSCDEICAKEQPKYGYYRKCDAGGSSGQKDEVVTVFLD
jgi:hypothetical protein